MLFSALVRTVIVCCCYCCGHIVDLVLTRSFKLACHCAVCLIGHLHSTNRIHRQSQLKCVIYSPLPVTSDPSAAFVTPGSGLESPLDEAIDWGCCHWDISSDVFVFTRAAVTSEPCQHLSNFRNYQQTSGLVICSCLLLTTSTIQNEKCSLCEKL